MTEKKAALCISVGKEETDPVSSRRRIALLELDLDETDSNTVPASGEDRAKSRPDLLRTESDGNG